MELKAMKADEELAAKAHQLLRRSTYPAVQQLVCTAKDGVVTIRGKLSSFYQKSLAQQILLAGNLAVVNQTEVEDRHAVVES